MLQEKSQIKTQISKFRAVGDQVELSTLEFRSSLEKVISRFRIESVKEMLRTKQILEDSANHQVEARNREHLSETSYYKQKVC